MSQTYIANYNREHYDLREMTYSQP